LNVAKQGKEFMKREGKDLRRRRTEKTRKRTFPSLFLTVRGAGAYSCRSVGCRNLSEDKLWGNGETESGKRNVNIKE